MAAISLITGIAAALLLAPAAWAQDTTRPPPLVLAGVTVVDVRAGVLLPMRTVVVEDGRIARVVSADAAVAPPGAIVVDGTGRFLIPGLIDMHTHPQPRDFPLYLAAGVTTLRVMAGNRQQLRLREEVRTGRRLGPTLVVGGPIVESPPPAGYGSIVTANRRYVTTAEEGAREVEAQRAAGFDFIKIYNHLSADAFAGIARAARERGMDVVGHVPFAVGTEGAISGGMRTIEHGRGYLHMLLPPEINAATGPDMQSRILAWRHADTLKIPEIARLTAAAGGVWNCPTLVVDRMLWPSERMIPFLAGPYAPLLNRPRQQMLMNRSRVQWASNFSEDDFRAADHAYAVKSRIVRALRDAGAPLCAGSDAWPPAGFSLHDELRLLVEAGLTPLESLRAATSSAADAMRRADLGEVAEGRHADLVLLDSDILADIDAVKQIHGVVLGGRWLPRIALDSMVREFADANRRTIVTAAGSAADARALHGGKGPALSPDARTVYFLSDETSDVRHIHWPLGPGRRSIFATTKLLAAPRASGTPRVLASGVIADAFERAYDVSPDGSSIVYVGFADDSTPAIMRVATRGGAARVLHRLAEPGTVMPRWSPNGRAIAFTTRDGLFTLSAGGGQPRRLSSIPFWDAEVRWSPDGTRLAAIGGTDADSPQTLFVVPAAGGEARRVTPEAEDADYKEGIRWHPDGRRISFMCYCGDGEVRIATLDGAPSRRLVDVPDQWDWYGDWSRDGAKFYFLSYGELNGLFELDMATGATRFLADAAELPDWGAGGVLAWSVEGR